jgi:hypothetical protein
MEIDLICNHPGFQTLLFANFSIGTGWAVPSSVTSPAKSGAGL